MLDGMGIRSHIDWSASSTSTAGYVNHGDGVKEGAKEATEALVFMVVGLRAHWKIPICYLLINGISATILSNHVKDIIQYLHDIDVQCQALVMDGHATNQSLVNILGGRFHHSEIRPYFLHPATQNPVFIFFDACHLLKNVRGLLESSDLITTDGTAKWQDIKNLHELQVKEGLRAANKLTDSHVNFKNRKMKVKLAVQTLSRSVASALEYASLVDGSQFSYCIGTIEFIKLIDQLFDVFNSRNPLANGFKSPLNANNWADTKNFLRKARDVLMTICDSNGVRIVASRRKMGLLGFVLNIDSLLLFGDEILLGREPLNYFLTYRLSQDHLETFFSAVRQRGGWNNNPSAVQFAQAYRALLSHAGLATFFISNANCETSDFSLLSLPHDFYSFDEPSFDFVEPNWFHDLSLFADGIIVYMAGWVVRKMINSDNFKCLDCRYSLIRPATKSSAADGLLRIKNNGELVFPSDSVVIILRTCEKYIRSNEFSNKLKVAQWEANFVRYVINQIPTNLFSELDSHFTDSSFGIDNHYFHLIKVICTTYITLRRFHVINMRNATSSSKSVRHTLTKQIIFHHD